MISVLLIILKIIGIVLLSLIGIAIALLLLVLFVPVKYRFKGYYKDEFVCHGKITWLLHLVSFSIDFEKELITSIKIFGIPLAALKKTDKKVDNSKTEVNSKDSKNSDVKEAKNKDKKASTNAENKTTESEVTELEIGSSDHTVEQTSDNQTQKAKKSFFEKIVTPFKKLKQKIQDIIQKIQEFLDKIRNIFVNIRTKKDTVQHYITILQREEVKQAFSLCKKRIWILIKHILPKKMRVVVDYGFEDPATTGYILAVYGMLPAFVGKRILLHPDFNKQLLECVFNIKGSVNAWSLLHQLLCIILDKNCRALYHIVKKEIMNERK